MDASFSQGFRTGTFPVTSFPNPVLFQPIRPERITAYEFGFKTAMTKVRFDAIVSYYDFKGLQVGLTVPHPLAPTSVGAFGDYRQFGEPVTYGGRQGFKF